MGLHDLGGLFGLSVDAVAEGADDQGCDTEAEDNETDDLMGGGEVGRLNRVSIFMIVTQVELGNFHLRSYSSC